MTEVDSDSLPTSYDVVIVGAGITGINAAYRLATEMPHLSYTILERREETGGTWSFFKYPGLRSDSDLYTMGFQWKPWAEKHPIASGPAIADYIQTAAEEQGIHKNVRLNHDVKSFNWRSDHQSWEVTVSVGGAQPTIINGRFVIAGTGFFDYKQARESDIPGLDNFKGMVMHPQFWTKENVYADKRVVIVGSGATAVTMLPVVAKTAANTVMLQRSPSYIMSMHSFSPWDDRFRTWLPTSWANFMIRWRFTLAVWFFFHYSRWSPEGARAKLEKITRSELPPGIEYAPDFKPKYAVWDQRLCVVPDGDLFKAIATEKAQVRTGVIDAVEADGIRLKSGEKIEADIIVTATGLKLQMLGGADITLDSKRKVQVHEQFMWRGTMLSEVPNFMLVIGHYNSSWTLGSDLAVRTFIKTMQKMEKKGQTSIVPRMSAEEQKSIVATPLWDMSSTYLQKSAYPKAATKGPWVVKSNYIRDYCIMLWGDLTTGMRFESIAVDKKKV